MRITLGPANSLKPLVQAAMRRHNPALVVGELKTMQEQIAEDTSDTQALAVLALGFSALALLLASIGLYGTLAYATERRRREIGVRLALGSPRAKIMALITREMSWVAALAALAAIPATLALGRLFRSQLYGVTGFAPWSLMAALGLTLLALGLAAGLPVVRAASVDPAEVLRKE